MIKINDNWKNEEYKWRRISSENYNKKWLSTQKFKGIESVDKSRLGLSSDKTKDSIGFQIVWLKNIDRLIDMMPLSFNPAEYTLIDVGCGTGISTFYFSEFYEFSNFIGFDFSSKLIKIARRNLSSFSSKKVNKINFFESDARNFKLPNKPCFIFMYNPFGFQTAKQFIQNNLSVLKCNGSYIAISYDIWIEKLLEMNIHKKHFRDVFHNLSIVSI